MTYYEGMCGNIQFDLCPSLMFASFAGALTPPKTLRPYTKQLGFLDSDGG